MHASTTNRPELAGSKHGDGRSVSSTDDEDGDVVKKCKPTAAKNWRVCPTRKMIILVMMGMVASALVGVVLYYRQPKERHGTNITNNRGQETTPSTITQQSPWWHDCGTGTIRMYPLRPLLDLSSYAAPDPSILPLFTQEAIQANASSPPARAWNWIQRHPDFHYMSDERKRQRMAMATLHFACDPFFPDDHHNQICYSPTDECFHPRYGYGELEDHPQRRCDKEGTLTNLDLSDLELSGTLPAELSLLTALTHLKLSDNYLTGQLPAELGLLSSLENMSLFVNDLRGTLATELGQLTKLTRLWFGDNADMTGPVPTELGRLTALEDLSLAYTVSHAWDKICTM